MLMEQAIRLLGIDAQYQHVLAAISLPVPLFTCGSSVGSPYRDPHCGVREELWLYFPSFGPWNWGEGCCLVNGKLYSAFAGGVVGETGGIVDFGVKYGGSRYVTASSAAHHVLLQLDNNQRSDGNYYLERWMNVYNHSACNNNEYHLVPGAPTPIP
jgi:hypothetical protein